MISVSSLHGTVNIVLQFYVNILPFLYLSARQYTAKLRPCNVLPLQIYVALLNKDSLVLPVRNRWESDLSSVPTAAVNSNLNHLSSCSYGADICTSYLEYRGSWEQDGCWPDELMWCQDSVLSHRYNVVLITYSCTRGQMQTAFRVATGPYISLTPKIPACSFSELEKH